MKKTNLILMILLAVFTVSTVLSYMALHDISHDYVSKKVIGQNDFPLWTDCAGEWIVVTIDFIIRIVLIIVIIITLIRDKKKQKKYPDTMARGDE